MKNVSQHAFNGRPGEDLMAQDQLELLRTYIQYLEEQTGEKFTYEAVTINGIVYIKLLGPDVSKLL